MRPFKHRDDVGVYRAVADLYGDPALHACPKYAWRGHDPPFGWRVSKANLERLHAENRIHYNSNNKPFRKQYRAEWAGQAVSNLWDDIPIARGKERISYPTQKPLALLERIIAASSNEGDVVLDPFAGCATSCVAAERLRRQWVGIDLSPLAAKLVKSRLRNASTWEPTPTAEHPGLFYDVTHRSDIPKRTDLGKLPNYRTHRKQLYGEQAGDCAGCRVHFEARNLEVDHIISRRKGGTDHIDNLQLLCGSCNRIKGDRGMEYLRTKLQLH